MLIDQVEVLVGPPGTLYGRNAIGGLINTKSRRPTSDYTGEVRLNIGNFQATKVEGTFSGPVPYVPNLTFRVSGYYDGQNKGYLDNVAPGGLSEGGVRHDLYGEFQLQYKGDKDDVWFDTYVVGFNGDRGGPGALLGTPTVGQYDTALTVPGQITSSTRISPTRASQPGFVPVGTPITGPVPGTATGTIPGGNPADADIRSFAHNVPTNITVDAAPTFTLHWTHHFDGFDVRYVGGYSQYHYELHSALFANDNSSVTQYQIPINAPSADLSQSLCADISAYGLCRPLTVNPTQVFNFSTQTDWSSHEITFSSTNNSPLQWIAGAYYYWETDNNPITVGEPDQSQIKNPVTLAGIPTAIGAQAMGMPIPASALAAPNPSGDYYFTDYQDRVQSIAGYAQVDYKITSTIKLTGGLRYTYDWKHAQEETRYILFSDGALNPAVYGSLLPAVDFTQALTSQSVDQGVCAAPTAATSGPYAGAQVRCLRGDSSAVTGTAGIQWTPDNDTLAYARYNRGYKAFALNAGLNGPNPEVKPEFVNDYEVGLKKTFPSSNLRHRPRWISVLRLSERPGTVVVHPDNRLGQRSRHRSGRVHQHPEGRLGGCGADGRLAPDSRVGPQPDLRLRPHLHLLEVHGGERCRHRSLLSRSSRWARRPARRPSGGRAADRRILLSGGRWQRTASGAGKQDCRQHQLHMEL